MNFSPSYYYYYLLSLQGIKAGRLTTVDTIVCKSVSLHCTYCVTKMNALVIAFFALVTGAAVVAIELQLNMKQSGPNPDGSYSSSFGPAYSIIELDELSNDEQQLPSRDEITVYDTNLTIPNTLT